MEAVRSRKVNKEHENAGSVALNTLQRAELLHGVSRGAGRSPASFGGCCLWSQGCQVMKTVPTKAANSHEAISVERALCFSHLIIATVVDVEAEA